MSQEERKEGPSLEERLASLEDIIGKMEAEDVPLEESFNLYKQGLSQVKEANSMLDEMEKAMLVLTDDGQTEAF